LTRTIGIRHLHTCLLHGSNFVGRSVFYILKGLGKTIQVLSLLAALFKKAGNGLDARQLEHRTRVVREKVEKFRAKQDEALEQGRVVSMTDILFSAEAKKELYLSARWCPVLIVVPLATLENWQREFAEWTHFGVAVYHGAKERERAMERIRNGTAEVILTPSSCFQGKETFPELKKIPWRMVVIDEFHIFRV
jgi:SNF2 family DNA or RNA helicase